MAQSRQCPGSQPPPPSVFRPPSHQRKRPWRSSLRKTLLVSLDGLLAVVREFLNPNVSRSGLDRCLRRHGVGSLRDLKAKDERPKHSGFKAYEPGYIHIDMKYLPQMANETSREYLFVAIDRASRWLFIAVYRHKTAANAWRFLGDLERACLIHIRAILTDNEKELTDRLWACESALQRDSMSST